MNKLLTIGVTFVLLFSVSLAQTPQNPPPSPQDPAASPQDLGPEDVVRISVSLVQTDVVVTDKNDQIISDLNLDDFKVTENGKRQDVKFAQFVSGDAGPRLDGSVTVAGQPVDPEVARNLSARDLRRVFAFVVDDLTIPFEEIVTVRQMLTDFIDNRMRDGDLVAIVRVVGGAGILQQFTTDKRILRLAVSRITPQLHPFSAFNNLATASSIRSEVAASLKEALGRDLPQEATSAANANLDASEDGTTRGFRALATLSMAGDVTNSMKALPGRKSLVLISGGLPMSESNLNQVNIGLAPVSVVETRSYLGNVNYVLKQLIDRASRAGVVINTMDIRGLQASRGVSLFTDPGNEATSHLGTGNQGQGRLPSMGTFDNLSLDTLTGHQGLQALAEATGGVSAVNSNNFRTGLDKILARSSYYLIAYTPTEPFDRKYHKLEIKVTRPGAKVYAREGYFAIPDPPQGPQTKEAAIIKAAMSPLAKREIGLAGRLQYRFLPENVAEVDINLLVNANDLEFKQGANGKYQSSFDVVGFVVNSMGKSQGGFSQTVAANLSPEDYKRAQTYGVSYTAHAQLPPGSYQLRAVVRESESGRLGSMSQYLEVPDISKKNLTASSLFLYAVKVDQGGNGSPQPLTALRQLPRQQDLRYAAVVYFPKVSDGKIQLTSQVIVSLGDKIVFQEAEQPVTGPIQDGQVVKIGQLGLSKAQPGRYVLTLLLKEPGKKERGVIRSVDFNLVE
jgi:VWFA-related protein